MAVTYAGTDISAVAGESLTGKQYHALTQETDGKVDLGDSAGELCLGVLQSGGTVGDGDVCRVRVEGISKVVVSTAVDEGAELSVGTDGRLGPASAGDYVAALALEAASAGDDVIRAKLVTYQKNPES